MLQMGVLFDLEVLLLNHAFVDLLDWRVQCFRELRVLSLNFQEHGVEPFFDASAVTTDR